MALDHSLQAGSEHTAGVAFTGCLLLNTGISLLCVSYELLSEGNDVSAIMNSNLAAQFTTHDVKCFVVQTFPVRTTGTQCGFHVS